MHRRHRLPMNTRKFANVLLALGILSSFASAHSAEPTDKPRPTRSMTGADARNNNPEGEGLAKSAPSGLGKADRAFITKAAEGSLFELAAAELALKKSSDARVKQYAAAMAKEHGAALKGLKQVGVNHNYPLPEELTQESAKRLDRLKDLSGQDFDNAFKSDVGLNANEEDTKLLKRAKRATRNQDLGAWIDQTLPVLQKQMQRATQLAKG